ncbi:TetR/AcrR family transcriptional regulator [Nocardia arthritidis]|uniref:TetR family transcriptional regulator n=1 Tax=Nocardia arthritidis TaxID=228602 RepID=A0A6G9YA12_9NOCA|nr:TetR family transcriptional regulator [Nocardia arthritidis]QIS09960.1 TetR family transcriptional regulator [Nocardia arthritidis]
MGFQRARSEEQRQARRRTILDTAAAMLADRPVADIGLNELARCVGLAKSNVLRYFESREAVLLELLDLTYREWLAELRPKLSGATGELPARRKWVIDAVVSTLVAKPMLCELWSSQAAVLERNVSPEVAARFKRSWLAATAELSELVRGALPELGPDDAMKFAGVLVFSAGSLWSHTNPSAAMLTAYERNPDLAAVRLDFATALTELLTVIAKGVLAPE